MVQKSACTTLVLYHKTDTTARILPCNVIHFTLCNGSKERLYYARIVP
nr:MAG TPA: hypothetical protein [Caudoviricetes sp.]